MENRKKGLYTAKVCRFCLSQDEPLTSLFEKKQAPKNSVPLSLKILSSISVEVFPSEKMPPYICRRCTFFMDVVYSFKNVCREGDKSILDFVQSGSALEPIVWPPSLVKLFRYGAKPTAETAVMKVEGGATVEVSQGMSDSEDDDENVYNVKIGDGSEEGASACVKVVTSKDTEKNRKEKKKDCDDVELESESAKPSAQDRCWACDECDCTYPLQQLLELHKMQKHRTKDVACDLCDAKFFNKYDLSVHMLRHTNETPFVCVACSKGFKRLIQLKRHEKLLHSDLPQLKCAHCPASFLSEGECEAHQLRHRHVAERKYACTDCDRRFFEHSSLMKHIDSVHESKLTHACEYCPEQFTSIRKLTRHVRTHAGERPYPCKYCEKSFTKSHHYTRHLRSKHSEVSRGTRSSVDEYRCEQCTAAFQSQDELIYHSAIHATQNLTCPLCQEKFQDVDAVTSHIKSHVTGMEYMCDFCELVFTTKDKLDLHIDNAHEDELRNSEELGQDDTSMEMDGEDDDDDDNPINVKVEGDHMVVEIKKPNEFMLSTMDREFEEKINITNSEESEPESAMMEEPSLPAHEMLPAPPAQLPPLTPAPTAHTPSPPAIVASPTINVDSPSIIVASPITQTPAPTPVRTPQKLDTSNNAILSLTASILRKAEEVKRKVVQETPPQEKKEKAKVESSTGGANDKSLRLLEKELQELQRTKKREEVTKTPMKSLEAIRGRGRPPIHTSTPKLRSEERKPITTKSTPTEKKAPERRAVKENKKPEDSKDSKTNNGSAKEDKDKTREDKDKTREDKDKTREDKETKARDDKEAKANVSKEENRDKTSVKNGSNANNKSAIDEPVRRSSRPSKVKDYAKMVNHRNEETKPSDDDSDDEDDYEYVELDKPEVRPKARRVSHKPACKPQAAAASPAAAATPRKRGRPRKNAAASEVPIKVKKSDNEENENSKPENMETESITKTKVKSNQDNESKESINLSQDDAKPANVEQKPSNLLVATTGQTLKKVPIKALPPGVKPLPLPATARPMGTPEMCEMQIGKKMVKVQKIVMTKAEVEAMAKKGLVEMKDGTMVLKPGVKIPSDPNAIKSTLVGEGEKGALIESISKSTPPTRCELGGA